jgi:hypothetical protein
MNYKEANELLQGRCREQRKLANNTYLIRLTTQKRLKNGLYGEPKPCFAIRLHNTDIIKFFPDGTIELNSSGWRTATTKNRMNKYLPAEIDVFQKDFNWFVNFWKDPETKTKGVSLFVTYDFQDGMKITRRGKLVR